MRQTLSQFTSLPFLRAQYLADPIGIATIISIAGSLSVGLPQCAYLDVVKSVGLTGVRTQSEMTRTSDLHPPLGKPGGPCQVVERIEHNVRAPALKNDMVHEVMDGTDLSNSESSKIYPILKEHGVGDIKQVNITSHAQYRMDLRGITVDDVRHAVGSFLQQMEDWKKLGSPAYKNMSTALESGDKLEWVGKNKLKVVLSPTGNGSVTLISAFWRDHNEHTPPQTCTLPKNASVIRRHLLKELLRAPRMKFAIRMDADLPILWMENEKGDRLIPDLRGDMPPHTPNEYIYQFSRFPRQLTENMLMLITEEEVSACSHPKTREDLGLIEGLEGRICLHCGGSQVKGIGNPWPTEWRSGGSTSIGSMNSSFSADLVLAMTRPTNEEIQKAEQRGHTIVPVDLDRAILFAGTACERCMNVLLWRFGCDDGYEEGSPAWVRSNTCCELCEDEFPITYPVGIPTVTQV